MTSCFSTDTARIKKKKSFPHLLLQIFFILSKENPKEHLFFFCFVWFSFFLNLCLCLVLWIFFWGLVFCMLDPLSFPHLAFTKRKKNKTANLLKALFVSTCTRTFSSERGHLLARVEGRTQTILFLILHHLRVLFDRFFFGEFSFFFWG